MYQNAWAESLESRCLLSVGDLNLAFGGGDGMIRFSPAPHGAVARKVVAQPDGKFVVVEYDDKATRLQRFGPDGSVDKTFGNAGLATLINGADDFARQADGKFIVVGSNGGEGFLARYTAAGKLDKSFGNDGLITTSFTLNTIVVLSSGKFATSSRDAGIVEFHSDGTLDKSFGNNGLYPEQVDAADAIVEQKDNKLLVAGQMFSTNGSNDFDGSLTRITAAGHRDNTFNHGKVVDITFEFESQYFKGMVVQSTGRIVVAMIDSGDNGHLLGYRSDGSPDPSFQGGIENFSSSEFDELDGISLYGKDHIAFFGGVEDDFALRHNFAILGFTPNGIQEFNKTIDLGWVDGEHDDIPAAATMTADGNILLVGNADEEESIDEESDDGVQPQIELVSIQGKPGGPTDQIPVSFTETQIIITGTSHADTILVDGDKGNANLYIELDGNRTHFVGAVGRDDTIIVNAGGANDRIENFSDIPVILNGGAGNDTLIGGSGADTFIGGPGNDTADYSSRSANLNISLDNVANDGSLGEKDNVMADVETILGGSGNDKILGNPFANLLVGNGGNDILYGGKGNDTLNGGTGHDQLFGQDDNDILLAKDGQVDSLDGGADSDTAQRDNTAAVKDQVLNIETSI